MAISFRSNLPSLRAQRAVNTATSNLSNSYLRLSSGSRINKASDDPAGLAVSSSLTAKTRVLNRGRLNVADGISALEIADGTLGQVSVLLNRMAELSEQAANGSYSSVQRAALDKEFSQLNQEIRRISGTTTFNGNPLLTGEKSARTTAITVASSPFGTAEFSSDGRYVTYRSSLGALTQKDTVTGIETTLVAASNPSDIEVSASGEQILFSSTVNLNGLNASGNTAYYVYTRGTQTLTKLFTAGAGDQIDAEISADGSTVAFASEYQYSANGTASGGTGDRYIHTLNTASGLINQSYSFDASLYSFNYSSNALTLSANGSYVGFVTDDRNIDQSYVNLFAVGSGRAAVTTIGAATNSFTMNLLVSNSGEGYFIDGGTIDGTGGIYVARIGASDMSFGSSLLTKVANINDGFSAIAFSLSHDNSYLTFLSTSDYTGENAIHQTQAFEYDFATGTVTQKTNYTTGVLGSVTGLTADGNSATYFPGTALAYYDISRASRSLAIDSGLGTGANKVISSSLGAVTGALRGLGTHLLTTQASARGALEATRRNIELLDDVRGHIGAGVSRLNSASRIVGATADQFSIARSRIRDVDVADETARLVRNQIVQQAGTAILAQANQQPEIVLGLLGAGGR